MRKRKKIGLYAVALISLFLGSGEKKVAAVEVDHHGNFVDDSSVTDCEECHDANWFMEKAEKKIGSSVTSHVSHPQNIHYPPKGREFQFRSQIEAQELGIRFDNGTMTCRSCHDLQNRDKGHLTVENFQSRLCMACHNM